MEIGDIQVLFLLVVLFMYNINAMQSGDRVSVLTQTLHNNMKTPILDLPVHQMPRFTLSDVHIFHASIPRLSVNASEYRINPLEDLKVSLNFNGNKLSIPWITVYNSKEKVSLKKLTVIFTHDQFEIVRLHHITTYGSKMQKVDPSHPALRGFEMEYKWESVEEEDFGFGIIVLFTSVLISFLWFFSLIICDSELLDFYATLHTSNNKKKILNLNKNEKR